MNRLRFFVYAVRPAYIDIHVQLAGLTWRKVKDALRSSANLKVTVDGKDIEWRDPQQLKPAGEGFQVRFGVVADDPDGELTPGRDVQMTLKIGDATLAASTTVIDPASPGNELLDEVRDAREAASIYAAYPLLVSPPPEGGLPRG